MGRRELLDVIRSKPVLKKMDLTLDHIKLYKIFQNLDGIAISRQPKKKKNLLLSNDPPETEPSYDIRYVTRRYVSHSETIPE